MNAYFLGVVTLGLISWGIIGIFIEGPLVLLSAIPSAKLSIWALISSIGAIIIVITIHLILVWGVMPLLMILVADMSQMEFMHLLRNIGGETVIYCVIAGLFTYTGTRIWKCKIWSGQYKYFLLLPRSILSLGFVVAGWILLSWDMIALFLLIAMGRHR